MYVAAAIVIVGGGYLAVPRFLAFSCLPYLAVPRFLVFLVFFNLFMYVAAASCCPYATADFVLAVAFVLALALALALTYLSLALALASAFVLALSWLSLT